MASYSLSVITVGLDPTIELGPVTLAWHGLTIAIGILVGSLLAARAARERGFPSDPLYTIASVVGLAGLVGGKVVYLIESGAIVEPGEWLSSRGFTFNGGLIFAAVAIAVYLRRAGIGLAYLDVVAVAFPLGVAVGRVGDVINGEHYGPPSTWPLAVRNTHPDADVPSADVAYHSGGLYEVLIALTILAIVWPLRHRFTRPLSAVWTVIALFSAGRFIEFFYRSDSDEVLLGLNGTQWTSLAVLAVALAGLSIALRRSTSSGASTPSAPKARYAGRST